MATPQKQSSSPSSVPDSDAFPSDAESSSQTLKTQKMKQISQSSKISYLSLGKKGIKIPFLCVSNFAKGFLLLIFVISTTFIFLFSFTKEKAISSCKEIQENFSIDAFVLTKDGKDGLFLVIETFRDSYEEKSVFDSFSGWSKVNGDVINLDNCDVITRGTQVQKVCMAIERWTDEAELKQVFVKFAKEDKIYLKIYRWRNQNEDIKSPTDDRLKIWEGFIPLHTGTFSKNQTGAKVSSL